jgi:hypothetical protein
MSAATGVNAGPGLYRQAIRLEQFSIAWMTIEAGAAVTAGIIAGSLALTSFGRLEGREAWHALFC